MFGTLLLALAEERRVDELKIQEIAQALDTSERTVLRYFQLQN